MSARNLQPWRFVVVRSIATTLKEIGALCSTGKFVADAPAAIVVLKDVTNARWADVDCAQAVQNMANAGLGARVSARAGSAISTLRKSARCSRCRTGGRSSRFCRSDTPTRKIRRKGNRSSRGGRWCIRSALGIPDGGNFSMGKQRRRISHACAAGGRGDPCTGIHTERNAAAAFRGLLWEGGR